MFDCEHCEELLIARRPSSLHVFASPALQDSHTLLEMFLYSYCLF